MYKIVDNYCSSCEISARRRLGSPKPIALLGALRTVNFPFERVAVDVVGPFPTTKRGNKVLVVFIDHLSGLGRWQSRIRRPKQ